MRRFYTARVVADSRCRVTVEAEKQQTSWKDGHSEGVSHWHIQKMKDEVVKGCEVQDRCDALTEGAEVKLQEVALEEAQDRPMVRLALLETPTDQSQYRLQYLNQPKVDDNPAAHSDVRWTC